MTNSIFATALMERYRYESAKGELTTEDLFRLPLQAKNNHSLDAVAIHLHQQIESAPKVSFVDASTPADQLLAKKLEVVKEVIKLRQEKNATELAERSRRAEIARLTELRQRRQGEAEESLSLEEIDARMKELEGGGAPASK